MLWSQLQSIDQSHITRQSRCFSKYLFFVTPAFQGSISPCINNYYPSVWFPSINPIVLSSANHNITMMMMMMTMSQQPHQRPGGDSEWWATFQREIVASRALRAQIPLTRRSSSFRIIRPCSPIIPNWVESQTWSGNGGDGLLMCV